MRDLLHCMLMLSKEEKEDEDKSKFQISIEKRLGKTRINEYKNPNHLMIAGEHEQVKKDIWKKKIIILTKYDCF